MARDAAVAAAGSPSPGRDREAHPAPARGRGSVLLGDHVEMSLVLGCQ